jgi:hypothetical protein
MKQNDGWTCAKCDAPVLGPFAECPCCGHRPERNQVAVIQLPPIDLGLSSLITAIAFYAPAGYLPTVIDPLIASMREDNLSNHEIATRLAGILLDGLSYSNWY